MNTWYNGKEITVETLLEELKSSIGVEGDLNKETDFIFSYIVKNNYEGKKQDLECIVEKLNERNHIGYEHPQANLQSVENIISKGEWNFRCRKLSITFTKGGSKSTSTRISLPPTWIKSMGIRDTEEDKQVKVTLNNNKIIIEKY